MRNQSCFASWLTMHMECELAKKCIKLKTKKVNRLSKGLVLISSSFDI